jgi:hypothetical protein
VVPVNHNYGRYNEQDRYYVTFNQRTGEPHGVGDHLAGFATGPARLTTGVLSAVPPKYRLVAIGAAVVFGFGIVCGIELEKVSVHVGDGRDVTTGQYEYQPAAPSVTAVPAVPPAGVVQ